MSMWIPYDRTSVQVWRPEPDPFDIGMKYNFNINVKLPGGQIIRSSDGKLPIYNMGTGDIIGHEEFDQNMYDQFQITIDQLEGEINVPYVFVREPVWVEEFPGSTITILGNEVTIPPIPAHWNIKQSIEARRSLLGGFAQFRINYQYVDQITQEVYTGEVITDRVLVPRYVAPPPPPPPPVFTIDENQIKEALADKIYEKFFDSSNEIIGNIDIGDIKTFQTTVSSNGIGYKLGRDSEDDPLIFFKKDRNTPENTKDFYDDGSRNDDPEGDIKKDLSGIITDISQSYAGTDANGVLDLSEKLDNNLSITRWIGAQGDTRVPSTEFDPTLVIQGTQSPLYYVDIVRYYLTYTGENPPGVQIKADFAEFHRYFENQEGDQRYQENGEDKPNEWINMLNLSQLTQPLSGFKINPTKAKEILDTDIFELLPQQSVRQNEINNFFTDFHELIGQSPSFEDSDNDGAGEVLVTDPSSRISSDPDNQSAYITRIDSEADDINEGKTLQTMRDTLNAYLGDVDNVIEEFPELPEYKNNSEGFLKLRKFNQAIIIRDPINVLEIEKPVTIFDGDNEISGPSWAVEGFTVTMWVRFLNSTTGGSLMTYGNPMLKQMPGFRLDTYTRSDYNPENNFVTNRRMVRLVVYENTFSNGKVYDSHFGVPFPLSSMDINDDGILQDDEFRGAKYRTWQEGGNPAYEEFAAMENGSWHVFMQHTQIPTTDLNEWFFICATYDPTIDEEGSFDDIEIPDHLRDKQFWLNHVNPNPQEVFSDEPPYGPTGEVEFLTVPNSGFGNKCKVEVISRTDLLTARGYKVE